MGTLEKPMGDERGFPSRSPLSTLVARPRFPAIAPIDESLEDASVVSNVLSRNSAQRKNIGSLSSTLSYLELI